MLLQEAARRRVERVARAQRCAPLREDALVLTDRAVDGSRRRPRGSQRGHGQAASRAGSGDPLESVSTSYPVSLTSTVCSHCADRLWSFVTTVQPSASWRMPGLPALIIGSIVNTMPGCSLR